MIALEDGEAPPALHRDKIQGSIKFVIALAGLQELAR
jgi:hypothetical protein